MTAPAHKIASLDRARFERLCRERADAAAKLATVNEALDAFRKAYSASQGYRVPLTVEQVKCELERVV